MHSLGTVTEETEVAGQLLTAIGAIGGIVGIILSVFMKTKKFLSKDWKVRILVPSLELSMSRKLFILITLYAF